MSKQEVLDSPRRRRLSNSRGGIAIGTIAGLTAHGEPIVRFVDGSLAAGSTVPIVSSDVGREAVIALERGGKRPIVLGLLVKPTGPTVSARLDGERIELSAGREIVLSCGKASITLTRAGKVLIRGAYILSRASGANRIKGGSVQIN